MKGYDGWGHDSQRDWRQGDRFRKEGFETFQSKYGAEAYALHHRFYLHFDKKNRLWLSAEDGCEVCIAFTCPSRVCLPSAIANKLCHFWIQLCTNETARPPAY